MMKILAGLSVIHAENTSWFVSYLILAIFIHDEHNTGIILQVNIFTSLLTLPLTNGVHN